MLQAVNVARVWCTIRCVATVIKTTETQAKLLTAGSITTEIPVDDLPVHRSRRLFEYLEWDSMVRVVRRTIPQMGDGYRRKEHDSRWRL